MKINQFVEYLENPIGLDCGKPRFSWQVLETDKKRQTSYRVMVGTEPSLTQELVWDSGLVCSDQSLQVPYEGKLLQPITEYYWNVSVGQDGEVFAESGTARFTTGLFGLPWQGKWIGPGGMGHDASRFWKKITLKKGIEKAYSFVAAINYYLLYINGKKTTDSVLNNADTDPDHTIESRMTDITPFLTPGENVIALDLGNGWPDISASRKLGGIRDHAFSMMMYVGYEDGTCQWIFSDSGDDWFYTMYTPFVHDSIYHGESYDARREIKGWNTTGYDPSAHRTLWYRALEYEPPGGAIKSLMLEPIRVLKTIQPKGVYPLEDGSYTFDMGQNFAGWARLTASGKKGQVITLSYGEAQQEDHSLDRISLRDAKATDTYTFDGEDGVYEPSFTFHGFRYVNVQGLNQPPKEDTVIGCVVSSDVKQIGSFTTSDPMINQLQSNVVWTEISNLRSVPTDCPQRDERLGWINDMTVRNDCALYNFRLPALYTKWMGDIRDTQGKISGALTDTAPFRRFGSRPADPVAAAPALVPWNLYVQYGDIRILEENYEMNRRWAAYLKRNSQDGIVNTSHMGDWAGPMAVTMAAKGQGIGGGAVSTITPPLLVGTIHTKYFYELLAKTAGVLGKKEEERYYAQEAEAWRAAILRHYYDGATKNLGTGSQGCNTEGLYFNIVPDEDRKAVAENLVADIRRQGNHLTTGNLCSRYILEVLFTMGYVDVAYDLITQTTYPSWGYMVENGATTMWERWEKVTDSHSALAGMASLSHPMNGAFAVSFYRYLAGIVPDEACNGYRRFTVKPHVPKKLKGIAASLETMQGIIRVSWEQKEDGLALRVTVPYNSKATIWIPVKGQTEYQMFEAEAGSYEWKGIQ